MVMALPWAMIVEVASLFDAALEKSAGLDQETRESWAEILLIWLRKVLHPKCLEDLRGISLINVLPKWIMVTMLNITESIPEPASRAHVCSFGFEKHRQTTEVSGCLQQVLAKNSEWQMDCPVYLFSGDVYRAFEYLSHSLALEVMTFANWPNCVKAVVHDANTDLTMKTTIPGVDPVAFRQNTCSKLEEWTLQNCGKLQ